MDNTPPISPANQRAIRALRAARQRSGGGQPAGAPQIRGPQLAPPVEQPQPAASTGYSSFMPAAAQAVMQQIQADSEQQIQKLTAQEQAAQADLDRQLEEDRERSRRMYSTEMEQETRFLTEEQAQERDERARRQRSRATPEGDRGDQEILQAQREKFREEFEPRHSGGRLVSTEVRDPRTRGERSDALRAASARQRSRAGVTEEEEARDLGYAGVGDFLGDGPEDLDAVINQSLGEAPQGEDSELLGLLTGDLSEGSAGRARLGEIERERERAAQIARRNRRNRRNRPGAASPPAEAPAAAETAAPAAAAATPTRNVGPMREGYAGAQGSSSGNQQAEVQRRQLTHRQRRQLRDAKVAGDQSRMETQRYVDERARRGRGEPRTGGPSFYERFNTRIGSNAGDFSR